MKMKKFTAVILALAMVFAMSANAFAVGNTSVSVDIQWEGESLYSATVTESDLDTYKTQLGYASHLYAVPENGATVNGAVFDQTKVTYLNTYTAADALIAGWAKANIDAGNYTSAADAIEDYSYEWYLNQSGTSSVWGVYFSMFGGLYDSADGVYVLERTYVEDGVTYYVYHWEGTSWELSINGQLANWYSSEYAFSDLSSVVFNYTAMESESFVTTYPLS